jgi:cytochrome c peroxidase
MRLTIKAKLIPTFELVPLLLAVGIFLLLAPDSSQAQAPESFRDAYRRPAEIPFPKANPYTPQKAELGKTLYFDPRLSRASALACASCHNPSFGWEDGKPKGTGDLMQPLRRHSPSILNGAWGEAFFWDGRSWTLEQQALGPITSEAEMNLPLDQLVVRLKNIPGYKQRFDAVFPGEGITGDTVAKAIATFERTIVSARAPFDAWVEGQDDAIPEAAKRGFLLFHTKAGCASCHGGWRFTNDSFHDIGLPDTSDGGRGELFPETPELNHTFKTPGLRNIDQRAPYMHDGSLPTLEAVVQHYGSGIVERPSLSPELPRIVLNKSETGDLVAFLHTLTSRDPPMPVPVLP